MRASRNLLILLLLPIGLVVAFSLVFVIGSISSLKTQFDLAAEAQTWDLGIIGEAARFSHDIGRIQQTMALALEGATAGVLTELQLYRIHTTIVNDLTDLGVRVTSLAESELVIDANHNSARGLQEEFESYRRFVIMTTDVIAVDPTVATAFLGEAQRHFRDFSVFASRIVSLLSERSSERANAQAEALRNVLLQVLLIGVVLLVLLLVVIYLIARRTSRQMLDIADALSALTEAEDTHHALPRIEAMQRQESGELGRIAGTLLTFRDAIERRREAEKEAFQLAFYDPLTKLPNRRLLLERLKLAASINERIDGHVGVLLLDLDAFRSINDTRGHAAGDALLRCIATRLQETLGDGETVARLGGDEFAIMIESLDGEPERVLRNLERRAIRVIDILARPSMLDGEEIYITASIGISLLDRDLLHPEDAIKHAETAMYQAKESGGNTYRFYDPEMQIRLENRVALENALRQSIDQQQLQLHYQIQVDEADRVTGLEALLRWAHPEWGLMPPAQFIPLAEESGLIVPIGHWTLETACRQLASWRSNSGRRELTIAVNVSARQFRQADFVDQVRATLNKTGADPRRLKLELTESTILEDIETAIARMHELRALGISFSMDDFGTGYSSLQYLKRLPLDQIKIDQSFVRDILSDSNDLVIVQTIIVMGHALGLQVIAEGVESREQRDLLLANECRAFQGYLFGKPKPLDALEPTLVTVALDSAQQA
mgnify:CR=1 FL=1